MVTMVTTPGDNASGRPNGHIDVSSNLRKEIAMQHEGSQPRISRRPDECRARVCSRLTKCRILKPINPMSKDWFQANDRIRS
jgi:hypothetical protein